MTEIVDAEPSSKALEELDLKTLARIHNGGPDGAKKISTLFYWTKVRKQLQENTDVRRTTNSTSH